LRHAVARELSRAAWIAGSKSPTISANIAMTIINSMSVNARRRGRDWNFWNQNVIVDH
jgi:hypothetical protein